MENPKISIITPSFNQAPYLAQTIESVLYQRYSNLEYIVIDGGSNDGSVDIIKKYSKYLKYWVSEPDKGQSDAINKGLKHVTGDIVNWLCSDDHLLPNALSKVALAFENKDTQLYIGGLHIVDEHNNLKSESYGRELSQTEAQNIARNPINQPSTFFRAEFIKSVGGVNVDLHYTMDFELWLKFFACYYLKNVIKEKKYIAAYRIHDTSKTNLEMDKTGLDFQTKFTYEKVMIFHRLAKLLGESRVADTLLRLVEGKDSSYALRLPQNTGYDTLKKALQYYVYDLGKRLLYNGKLLQAYDLLNVFPINNLPVEIQKDTRYLKRKYWMKKVFAV